MHEQRVQGVRLLLAVATDNDVRGGALSTYGAIIPGSLADDVGRLRVLLRAFWRLVRLVATRSDNRVRGRPGLIDSVVEQIKKPGEA